MRFPLLSVWLQLDSLGLPHSFDSRRSCSEILKASMTSIQSADDYDGDDVVVHSAQLREQEKAPLLEEGKSDSRREDSSQEDDPAAVKKRNRRRWRSIYVMYFTMFLSAVTFSIVLSSVWPYLLQVDYSHASASFLGWVVAAYSFGQLVASPFFGAWADWRPTREPLVFSLVITVVFNLLYSWTGAFSADIAGWILLISRALVGFGAGIAAVVRSYVSEATTESERTGAMAGISAAQALGFILGPAMGLAFVPLGSKGGHVQMGKLGLDFNMYTGPGYIGALLGVANILLLVLIFRECKLKGREKQNGGRKMQKLISESTASNASCAMQLGHFNRAAAAMAVVLFFIILFAFAVFETIATPLVMDEFAWSRKQAVFYNNAFFAALAVVAIASFIAVKFISRRVDERVLFMVALFLVALAFFVLIPMGNELPKITISTSIDALPANNSSVIPPVVVANATELEPVGCRDPPQTWCSHVPRIYLFQYLLALLLVAVGYPIASLLCYSIYSKILGPFPQVTGPLVYRDWL